MQAIHIAAPLLVADLRSLAPAWQCIELGGELPIDLAQQLRAVRPEANARPHHRAKNISHLLQQPAVATSPQPNE